MKGYALEPRKPGEPVEVGSTSANDTNALPKDDIVARLRGAITASGGVDIGGPALLAEAANTIEFLRKQSRGHFEAMTAVLRDGIEAVLPETPPKKPN